MIQLTTPVTIPKSDWQITPQMRGVVVGSCFATMVGNRLVGAGCAVTVNPQGVLYNPLSVARGIEILRHGEQFSASDLVFRDGLWHSWAHHSRFSAPTPQAVLTQINQPAVEHLDYLIITLGTAWVYERSGAVVGNCHKFPEAEFLRRRITLTEAVEALQRIRACYPTAKIIVSVSPIRHLRDGLVENSVSKSLLRLAADAFCGSEVGAIYFPAFELLVDELRDYRYYAQDMTHPSPLGEAVVFDRFAHSLLSEELRAGVKGWERACRQGVHRPLVDF